MPAEGLTRLALRVSGAVQGVGFRPFVFRLAHDHALAGFVRNDTFGASIEVEGDAGSVERFIDDLRRRPPALARISAIERTALAATGTRGFSIADSAIAAEPRALIPPDAATCDACVTELFDPNDRRHRYPFINCTDCGPRLTIVRDLPYDRERTTMARFRMCGACQAEYDDPRSRRFHAEPNACAVCGPRLSMPVEEIVDHLRRGRIVALKSLGGFHLAVDAMNDNAIARLRERKRRPHKPLAVMARDLDVVHSIAIADEQLLSPARPIVLLPLRTPWPAVAPHLDEVGVMLPYTPLHHLLAEQLPLLVMTSGNAAGEPISITNDEAMTRLGGIADVVVTHDRDIHTRADDSVIRVSQPIRRARGLVPQPIALPVSGSSVLAVGAQQKNTICVTRGAEAFLSQHIGDLDDAATADAFANTIESQQRLLAVEPAIVVHDLHPDYFSTRWALQSKLPRVAVQHHHAHIAACLAEHGRLGDVIGVAFDGTGCGEDGALWGGEFLHANLRGFRRVAHLPALPLPGGEAAIREPWRLAAAALIEAGEPLDLLDRIDAKRLAIVRRMIERDLNAPRATSAGRWFDAVAALCGLRDEISYEAQAAMELEAIAREDAEPYALDLREAIREIARDLRRGTPSPVIAARFHETMAAIIRETCLRIQTPRVVALSGGCFQNRRLAGRTRVLLETAGFEVLTHCLVPANDGGIALGQAAVALARAEGGDDVSRHSR